MNNLIKALVATSLLLSVITTNAQENKKIEPTGGIGGTGHKIVVESNDKVMNMNTMAHTTCADTNERGIVTYSNSAIPLGRICGDTLITTRDKDYLIISIKNNQYLTISGKASLSFENEIPLNHGKAPPSLKIYAGKVRIQKTDAPSSMSLYLSTMDSTIEIVGSDTEIFTQKIAEEKYEVTVRSYKGSSWIHTENESLFIGAGYVGKLEIDANFKQLSIHKDSGKFGSRIPIKAED